jgi:hypothetical protein
MAEETATGNERVGIRMDVLDNIISDLNANEELKVIFGDPVCASLIIVADDNDLRIEEGGVIKLTEEQTNHFVEILDSIIKVNSK